jgi:hypothetical protein
MKFDEALDRLAAGHIYGDPFQTADGATVITVAKIGHRGTAAPVGVFVVHGGKARWVPAVDANRIALIGVITGLLSAVISLLAVLRRPPWPDLSADNRSELVTRLANRLADRPWLGGQGGDRRVSAAQ